LRIEEIRDLIDEVCLAIVGSLWGYPFNNEEFLGLGIEYARAPTVGEPEDSP